MAHVLGYRGGTFTGGVWREPRLTWLAYLMCGPPKGSGARTSG